LQFHLFRVAAPFCSATTAGALDEDAAHRLGGGGEKLDSPAPLLLVFADQAEPGLMNERRRLKRLSGRFPGHLARRQTAQFLVNQRKQLLGGCGISLRHAVKNVLRRFQWLFLRKSEPARNVKPETVRLAVDFEKWISAGAPFPECCGDGGIEAV